MRFVTLMAALLLGAGVIALTAEYANADTHGTPSQNNCAEGSPAFDGFCGVGKGAPGPQGPAGPAGQDGADGADGKGVAGADGKDGAIGPAGKDGKDGKDGLDGLDGQGIDVNKALALSAAMSMPAWLEAGEQLRISGGLGFSGDGEVAFGITGVARVDGSVAAFGGLAVDGQGKHWAGKVGVSIGFK